MTAPIVRAAAPAEFLSREWLDQAAVHMPAFHADGITPCRPGNAFSAAYIPRAKEAPTAMPAKRGPKTNITFKKEAVGLDRNGRRCVDLAPKSKNNLCITNAAQSRIDKDHRDSIKRTISMRAVEA